MRYLLDTDICISFLKNNDSVAEKIEAVGIDNCYVSEITIIELTYGAYHSGHFKRHIIEVRKIEQLYDIISVYSSIDEFSKEKSRLRNLGQLIPDFDLLIGTSAVANDMIMVTNNVKHLSRIDSIRIENWRDEKWNEFIK